MSRIELLDQLVGGTVTSVIIDRDEDDGEDWYGLLIKPPIGKSKAVFFLRDDEANGPGSFHVQNWERQ